MEIIQLQRDRGLLAPVVQDSLVHNDMRFSFVFGFLQLRGGVCGISSRESGVIGMKEGMQSLQIFSNFGRRDGSRQNLLQQGWEVSALWRVIFEEVVGETFIARPSLLLVATRWVEGQKDREVTILPIVSVQHT